MVLIRCTSCNRCRVTAAADQQSGGCTPHLGADGQDLDGLGQGVGQGAQDEQPVQQVRRHPVRAQHVRAPHLQQCNREERPSGAGFFRLQTGGPVGTLRTDCCVSAPRSWGIGAVVINMHVPMVAWHRYGPSSQVRQGA